MCRSRSDKLWSASTKNVTVGMQRKGRQFGKMLGGENWQSFGTNKM